MRKRQAKKVILFINAIVTIAFPAICWGQTCASPKPSDTAFLPTNANPTTGLGISGQLALGTVPSIDTGASWYITRVVGPGTPGEFNPDGTLTDAAWNRYTANGILSKTAFIQVHLLNSADGGDPLPTDHHPLIPYVNGNNQDATFTLNWTLGDPSGAACGESLTIDGSVILEVQVPISTRYLKFPQRAANGSTPTPSLNQIAFATDAGNNFANVEVGTLSFQAMAPIVLVHGWNASPSGWGPPPPATNPCVNPNVKLNPNGAAGDFNFIQSFIDAGAPFDCSFYSGSPQSTTDEGAAALQIQLPVILASFGALHAHLVAHSKGGLFAREFLAKNAKQDPTKQIGVISVTTLETPHFGSVLGDTVAHFNSTGPTGVVLAFLRLLNAGPNALGKGANDLSPDAVAQFNQKYTTPPDQFNFSFNGNKFTTMPRYYSTSADADLNGDGVISGPEAPPYTENFANFSYQVVARGLPVTRVIDATRLLRASVASLNGDYAKNDCLVPIHSARYPSFMEINSYVGGMGRNHSTIREPDVAMLVLAQIRLAEILQP